MLSERETVVELPWAADSCPCVAGAANRVTSSVGISYSVVHLVSILRGVVSSARAGLGCVIVSALPVSTMLTRQRVCTCGGACVCGLSSRGRAVHT
jgi:hypothetical protein